MGRPDLADDAETVAGELFANAVTAQLAQGVTTVICVQCVVRTGVAVIDVYDDARGRPYLKPATADDQTGRGLHIVDELTGARWGSRAYGSGKVVTAWLGLKERPGGGPRCHGPLPPGRQRFTRPAATRARNPARSDEEPGP